MTKEYKQKRAKQLSNKLEAVKDQISNFMYQLERQQPYLSTISIEEVDQINSAYMDISEAINKLDYIANA